MVTNHVKVVAFRSQKLLPVTDVLVTWTAKPAAKVSDRGTFRPAVKALANGSGD